MTANRIVLGTAKLGLEGRDSAFEMLDAFVELGGRHIDTAHNYSDWVPGSGGGAKRSWASGSRPAGTATNSSSPPKARTRRATTLPPAVPTAPASEKTATRACSASG
jgi:hypothetical protein